MIGLNPVIVSWNSEPTWGRKPSFELSLAEIPHSGPARVSSHCVIGQAGRNQPPPLTALFFHRRGKEISLSRASWARAGRSSAVAAGARTETGHFAPVLSTARLPNIFTPPACTSLDKEHTVVSYCHLFFSRDVLSLSLPVSSPSTQLRRFAFSAGHTNTHTHTYTLRAVLQ